MALEKLDENGPDGNRKAPEDQKITIASQQVDAAMRKANKALEKLQALHANKRTKTGCTIFGCLLISCPLSRRWLATHPNPRFLHSILKQ